MKVYIIFYYVCSDASIERVYSTRQAAENYIEDECKKEWADDPDDDKVRYNHDFHTFMKFRNSLTIEEFEVIE